MQFARFAVVADGLSGYSRRVTWRGESVSRWLLAMVSGTCLALSFPKPGLAGLAWVAPMGMLFAAAGRSPGGAFRMGYLGGLAQHMVGLGWLLYIPFPVGNVAAWLGLSVYLALFQGVWVMLCWQLAAPRSPGSVDASWLVHLEHLLDQTALRRAGWPLFCAASWVGLEMIQSRFLTGFPWNLLGTSQYAMLPLIQVAALTGVYGVSFLIVWISVSLGLAMLRVVRQSKARWGWMGELRLPLLVVVSVGCAGMLRLTRQPPEPPGVKIALVQPSIPQELIWDETADARRFEEVMRLSQLALAAQPDLLVWPESAFVGATEDHYLEVAEMVARHKVWMIFSAEDAEAREDSQGQVSHDYFNAAFLLNAEGRLEGSYRKRRLVVFGEYVPLVRWLPFLRHFTPIEGGFTPGGGPEDFIVREPSLTASVLICFEDVFPHGARLHARNEVGLLVNLTNNGWFGASSAQWQHAAAAVFRAVENGVPLVRSTNNGLTCWIDSTGRIRQWLGQESGDVYGAGFLTVNVPLRPEGRVPTFYNRQGDVFGWSCVSVLAAGVLVARRRRT